ncbi:MAG: VWA domain-containing protein [Clostridiales bacterium]|nr:VWA domain-containing protein [Clostridiales bacterium]
MNVFLLLAAVFAVFIAVDILTAKLFTVKRAAPRNISLAALCVLTLASGAAGVLSAAQNADTSARTLYNAYSYLLEGNIDKAAENASKVQNPHSDVISLLADCWRGNYASAFIGADDLKNSGGLGGGLLAQADKIYALSRQMTGLEGGIPTDDEAREKLSEITDDCFALLKINERSEVEFLSGFKRDRMLNSDNFYETDPRTLSEMLLETPNDRELLRYSVKYYNAAGGLDAAEENARKLLETGKSADNIVLYTDVIAQKLINDMDITVYDESDNEISALLKKAESAEEAAGNYGENNPRRAENLAKAGDYREQANGVKAKRIINWLTAQTPIFGDSGGVIELQLSKLYAASGDEAKAREILIGLIKREDKISGESSIKSAIAELGAVYHDASASDSDIAAAIGAVLRADAFLPDSVLSRGYSRFLNNLLKYERMSIFVSRVNAGSYPTVRAYLNVNGRKDGVEELANDFAVGDFTFADNGFAVSNEKVTRIMDDTSNYISIALVIDGSGSMQGDRIENARRAVEACINNLAAQTQELSVIMYDDAVEILSPLTNDISKLRSGAERIVADGGTNIPIGLLGGIESLKDAVGTKAIILMTDGEDGNEGEMPGAIEAAQEENVAVFTVSTGGGNREYMENIADQTGGSYMEAVTDAELINVYTALQNYIVNNYCFEYTVEQDGESNPRVLTIGLADYEISSSRAYAYGGLVLTKDGSCVTRAESGALRLLRAEPSVVSVKDAELGVPIFVSAAGVTDGAKVFVNGGEVSGVKTAGDSAIAFTLSGKYNPGALNVTVKLTDGTSKSSDKLLTVGGTAGKKLAGQTIALGRNGNTLYADNVEQKDDYTLKLSGNVALNGFIRTNSTVAVQSNSPISSSAGRITLSGGSITGGGAAYADFPASKDAAANYGLTAFGGGSVKVLDSFGFYFDEYSVSLSYSGAALTLPGFGDVYGDARFNGSELIYNINDGCALADLQNNLNYALNGIPLPQNGMSGAVQMITGYSPRNRLEGYGGNGLYARAESLTVTIRKDFASVAGAGTVGGYLGLIEVADGKLTIDTNNADSMYELSGTAKFNNSQNLLRIDGQTPFAITSNGLYPERLTLRATGLSIDASGLSECFTSGAPQKALDAAITVNYPLSIIDEPYRGQVSSLLADVSLKCDKIEFICAGDWSANGIKAYDAANPSQYVKFAGGAVVVPISCVDELSLFGSDLGGEISGTATVSDRWIELNIDVDGHLDNAFYGVKHDGKVNITVQLPRGASAGTAVPVTLTCGGETLSYNAAVTGSVNPDDGFNTYAEDYGQ